MIKKNEQKTFIKGLLIGAIVGALFGDYFDVIQKAKGILNINRGA